MEEQCRGVTKSGRRCRNRTNLVDGYCRVHRDQAVSHETPAESGQKRQVERRVEEPGAAVFDEQVAAPTVSRAQEREAKPAPARPSEPSQPHREAPPQEQHLEERGWLVGLVSGALLALVAVTMALVGRRRRGR